MYMYVTLNVVTEWKEIESDDYLGVDLCGQHSLSGFEHYTHMVHTHNVTVS